MSDLIDVHVGTFSPSDWEAREHQQADWSAARLSRPQVATPGIDWHGVGLQPRWVGDDPSMAVAALEANNFAGRGSDEWRRFQAGAARRGELVLYVSTVRPRTTDGVMNVFGDYGSRVDLPYLGPESTLSFGGGQVTLARPPELADGLSATDRDLALRILSERPVGQSWVTLRPTVRDRSDYFGEWMPLLLTPDGEAVAGVWAAGDEGQGFAVRHYMVPNLPEYETLLKWLAERAIPDLVPTAGARSRRYVAALPELQTVREIQLNRELADLRSRYESEVASLTTLLEAEIESATRVRDALLFGTGPTLETAVGSVLEDAGVVVRPLDVELGRPASADFAVEYAGRRTLVEVKSAGGNAPERLVEALKRHLKTWPQLKPGEAINGGVMIVNHQHKLPPLDRDREVYRRQEFIDALDVQVISAMQLFDWWRRGDAASIRALFGADALAMPESASDGTAVSPGQRRRRWPGRGR